MTTGLAITLAGLQIRLKHAFTNELFHAGGENNTAKTIYHLFAYIVSNEEDYPNNEVFTKTLSNMKKLNAAREKAEESK